MVKHNNNSMGALHSLTWSVLHGQSHIIEILLAKIKIIIFKQSAIAVIVLAVQLLFL